MRLPSYSTRIRNTDSDGRRVLEASYFTFKRSITIWVWAIHLFVSYVVNLYKYLDFIQQKMLAFNKGSVPEIVIHGKTGFIMDSIDEIIEAVKAIPLINPIDCRTHIKDNFSIASMAVKYSDLYHQILGVNTLCQKTYQ